MIGGGDKKIWWKEKKKMREKWVFLKYFDEWWFLIKMDNKKVICWWKMGKFVIVSFWWIWADKKIWWKYENLGMKKKWVFLKYFDGRWFLIKIHNKKVIYLLKTNNFVIVNFWWNWEDKKIFLKKWKKRKMG